MLHSEELMSEMSSCFLSAEWIGFGVRWICSPCVHLRHCPLVCKQKICQSYLHALLQVAASTADAHAHAHTRTMSHTHGYTQVYTLAYTQASVHSLPSCTHAHMFWHTHTKAPACWLGLGADIVRAWRVRAICLRVSRSPHMLVSISTGEFNGRTILVKVKTWTWSKHETICDTLPMAFPSEMAVYTERKKALNTTKQTWHIDFQNASLPCLQFNFLTSFAWAFNQFIPSSKRTLPVFYGHSSSSK